MLEIANEKSAGPRPLDGLDTAAAHPVNAAVLLLHIKGDFSGGVSAPYNVISPLSSCQLPASLSLSAAEVQD